MELDDLLESRKFTIGLAVLTVISLTTAAASLSGVLDLGIGEVSPQQAGQTVSETLGNSSGSNFEVVSVDERSGLYEIDLSAQEQLQTVYVTKDAELFSTAMTSLSALQETVALQRSTESCLNSENVTLYGNITQQETQLQIQAMGGTNRVDGYYQDVNQEGVLQQAVDRGVQALPAFVHDGEVLSGVNNLSAVRGFAGCTS